MPRTKRWADLSPAQQRAIMAVAMVEAALKAAMLLDLKRRPAEQVRGSKRLWAMSTVINSAGVIPITYFVFGRRHAPDALSDAKGAQAAA